MDRLKQVSRSRSRTVPANGEHLRAAFSKSDQRLRAFLFGFGIVDEAALRTLSHRLFRLARGADSHALEAAAGAWFAGLPGWPESDAAAALATGRVAWLAADGARHWPLALFAETPPPGLAAALCAALPALPPRAFDDVMAPAGLDRARVRSLFYRPRRLRPRAV